MLENNILRYYNEFYNIPPPLQENAVVIFNWYVNYRGYIWQRQDKKIETENDLRMATKPYSI